jgi:threonine/homoserine/homoserine lactone efflux protein
LCRISGSCLRHAEGAQRRYHDARFGLGPQFVTAQGDRVPLQIALLGVILTVTVMAVNVGVAWAAGSLRRAFKPGSRFDHVGTGVLGLVFVGLALRMVFQEARAR